MGRIDWIPIADLPEELKDGRKVLLWDGGCHVSQWFGYWKGPITPQYFAEINAPDE